MRLAAWGCASLLLSGCLPISTSHFQTAAPLDQGEVQVGIGTDLMAKDQRYGLDSNRADGAGVEHHFSGVLIPSAEAHYGLLHGLQIGGKVYTIGGELDARATLLDTQVLKVAIGGDVGGFVGNQLSDHSEGGIERKTSRDFNGNYEDLIGTASIHFGDGFAVFGGPLLTRIYAHKHLVHTEGGVVTQNYTISGTANEAGAFAGIAIGDEVQFCPGITIYQESTTYPLTKWGGDGLFAFPWVGITVRPRHDHQRATPPGPAVEPPPP
jgi:hypothetical protein